MDYMIKGHIQNSNVVIRREHEQRVHPDVVEGVEREHGALVDGDDRGISNGLRLVRVVHVRDLRDQRRLPAALHPKHTRTRHASAAVATVTQKSEHTYNSDAAGMPGVEEGVEALTDSLGTAMSTTTFLSQERRPPAPESSTQLSRRDLARTSTPPAPPAARSTRRRTGRTVGRGERGGAMEVAAGEEALSGAEGSGVGCGFCNC